MNQNLLNINHCSSFEELDKCVLDIIHNQKPAFLEKQIDEFVYEKTDIFYVYEQKYKNLLNPHHIKEPKEKELEVNYTYGHDIDIMAPLFEKIKHETFIEYQIDYFLSYAAQFGSIQQFRRAVDLLERHEKDKDFDYAYHLYTSFLYPITDLPQDSLSDYKSHVEKFDLLLNTYKKDMRYSKEQVWISEASDPLYYYEGYEDPLSRVILHLMRTVDFEFPYQQIDSDIYRQYREQLFKLIFPHLAPHEIKNIFATLIDKNQGVDPLDKNPLLDMHMTEYVKSYIESQKLQASTPQALDKIGALKINKI